MSKNKYKILIIESIVLPFIFIGSVFLICTAIFAAIGDVPRLQQIKTAQKVVQMAKEFEKKGELEQALNVVYTALLRNKNNTELRATLRSILTVYLEREVREGRRRIDSDEHDIEAYAKIASAYSAIDDNFHGMEVLTEGVIENANAIPLWMAIATLELKNGRDNEALAVFREVIRIDGSRAFAHNQIAHLLSSSLKLKNSNLTQALKHARRAVALEPENPDFIDTLAEVEFKVGAPATAIVLMQKAIRLAPEDPLFKLHLQHFQQTDESENINQ